MVSRKYVGDYRLENVPDPRTGKLKTVPVYRGEWFAFIEDAQEIRSFRARACVLTALILAAFMTVLLLNAPCGHMYYVMVPFAAMIFPVYFQLAGVVRLMTAKARVTREHRDKLVNRAAICPAAMTLLSGVSAAGHVLYAFSEGLTLRDGVSFASAAIIFAASAVLFVLRGKVKMVKVSDKGE